MDDMADSSIPSIQRLATIGLTGPPGNILRRMSWKV